MHIVLPTVEGGKAAFVKVSWNPMRTVDPDVHREPMADYIVDSASISGKWRFCVE
ncbi:unnamed protein product [marine sediment metagenome]|uniref:Uncharacterized protein n=1 Tax=marine sediment metagenome TaxID=412755 RepID=X0VDB6_9ZZZZ